MEIVAGETSCYLLLGFISLKMEMSWRHIEIGKVHPNLPCYKKLHYNVDTTIADDIRRVFRSKTFDTVIPRNIAFSEASMVGKPAIIYSPDAALLPIES